MTNPLALAAKIFKSKACVCTVIGATAGSLGTVAVTHMVQPPAMPASYVAPKPMRTGIIQPKKRAPLCVTDNSYGQGIDWVGNVGTGTSGNGGNGGGTTKAPEPASFALLGAGLLGLGLVRWRA